MLGMLHKTNTITGASHLGAKPFILMSLAWCMMPMEPILAPLRAPPLWGHFVICNLVSCYNSIRRFIHQIMKNIHKTSYAQTTSGCHRLHRGLAHSSTHKLRLDVMACPLAGTLQHI